MLFVKKLSMEKYIFKMYVFQGEFTCVFEIISHHLFKKMIQFDFMNDIDQPCHFFLFYFYFLPVSFESILKQYLNIIKSLKA